jgi:hypothetical protein
MTAVGVVSALFRNSTGLAPHYTAQTAHFRALRAKCGRFGLNPDFRFERAGANLLILSDAFIHAGSGARNHVRRIYTQWVKSKTSRFSSVSTGF